MHRTRTSIAKVVGVALLGTAFAALGTSGAQALPLVPGVSVADGALQNSPLSPVRQESTPGNSSTQQEQSTATATVAGIPLSTTGVPTGLGG
ncbi:hypothetical protein [Streptomyces odontomachi]|uniref:hypothetical protein n=1 Tax=Streptomyces odontomachi TaxID=2944940 RepID=UPI0021094D6B|nr:hypothetical protein [Streptomyces sp. ODS25]